MPVHQQHPHERGHAVSDTEQAGTPADAVVDKTTGEIIPLSGVSLGRIDELSPTALQTWYDEMQSLPDEGNAQVQVDIARRILEADDIDSVWKATEVLTVDSVLNQPVEITAVRWAKSRHAEALPMFAVIEGNYTLTAGSFVLTCGAVNVVLTLYKLAKLGGLPAKVVFERKSTGTAGRAVITVKPAP